MFVPHNRLYWYCLYGTCRWSLGTDDCAQYANWLAWKTRSTQLVDRHLVHNGEWMLAVSYVRTGVESTLNEKYFACFISVNIMFLTLSAMRLTIPRRYMYDVTPLTALPYRCTWSKKRILFREEFQTPENISIPHRAKLVRFAYNTKLHNVKNFTVETILLSRPTSRQ